MRRDIEFKTEDGITLRGWFYPADGGGTAATVVMAHGFSATKEMHLDDFAAHFAGDGLNVLVYDNRNLGDSDSPLRGEIDPWQQIRDYRDAITFACTLEGVEPGRIGIWGSSYSGAHVLVVGAIDRRVGCVVSQVPLIDGLENARRLIRSDHWAGLRAGLDADREARWRGEPAGMIPVIAEDGVSPCVLPTADSAAFFSAIIKARETRWENAVTLRSVEYFTEYNPGAYIAALTPTPLMMVVARDDHLTPADLSLQAYERALQPKKLLLLPGGHFDAYVDEAFATSAPQQSAWFREHLT
ncbi:MAG: alpha/beta hydrolase [Rhodospirillales bacterium]